MASKARRSPSIFISIYRMLFFVYICLYCRIRIFEICLFSIFSCLHSYNTSHREFVIRFMYTVLLFPTLIHSHLRSAPIFLLSSLIVLRALCKIVFARNNDIHKQKRKKKKPNTGQNLCATEIYISISPFFFGATDANISDHDNVTWFSSYKFGRYTKCQAIFFPFRFTLLFHVTVF